MPVTTTFNLKSFRSVHFKLLTNSFVSPFSFNILEHSLYGSLKLVSQQISADWVLLLTSQGHLDGNERSRDSHRHKTGFKIQRCTRVKSKTCFLNVILGKTIFKNRFWIIICQKFKIRFHFKISNFSHGVFSVVPKLFYSPKKSRNHQKSRNWTIVSIF